MILKNEPTEMKTQMGNFKITFEEKYEYERKPYVWSGGKVKIKTKI